MQTIGIGIIGTRFGSMVHLPAFRRVDSCEIIGIVGHHPERTKEIAAHENIRAFDSWQELIADPSVHAVAVAVPPALYREIVIAAAEAGKAVLCDKPFGMDSNDARVMLAALNQAGKTHMINFEFREHPAFQYCKQWIHEARGGSMRHIELKWIVGSWADPARLWAWQCDLSQGGGILGALAVHSLDYIEWLFGPIVRLSATTGITVTERPAADGSIHAVTAPDHCHLLLTLQSGATVTCSISNVAPHGTGHRLECHGETQSLILESAAMDYGKGFTVSVADLGAKDFVPVITPSADEAASPDGRIAMMQPLAARFVDAVRSGRMDASPSFETGVRTQVLVEAIWEAKRTGSAVSVPA